jgi:hypothetical protein
MDLRLGNFKMPAVAMETANEDKIVYSTENAVITCLTRFLVFDAVPSVRIPSV